MAILLLLLLLRMCFRLAQWCREGGPNTKWLGKKSVPATRTCIWPILVAWAAGTEPRCDVQGRAAPDTGSPQRLPETCLPKGRGVFPPEMFIGTLHMGVTCPLD